MWTHSNTCWTFVNVESFRSLSQKGGKRDGEYEEGHYLSVCVCQAPRFQGSETGTTVLVLPPSFRMLSLPVGNIELHLQRM
jgi:hypothetical protein